MSGKLDMPAEHQLARIGSLSWPTHWGEARLGKMAGTMRGVKATTVLCANSKNVKIHSIAVLCTSSSAVSSCQRSAVCLAHRGTTSAG